MIDTDFSLSLKNVFEKIPGERRLELVENEVRMTTADGSLLPNYGKIHLLVQVGMKMHEHPFIVVELNNEGILETDILGTYGGSIDFARNKVCLDRETMATCKRMLSDISGQGSCHPSRAWDGVSREGTSRGPSRRELDGEFFE